MMVFLSQQLQRIGRLLGNSDYVYSITMTLAFIYNIIFMNYGILKNNIIILKLALLEDDLKCCTYYWKPWSI